MAWEENLSYFKTACAYCGIECLVIEKRGQKAWCNVVCKTKWDRQKRMVKR